ncbi:MAG: hypothetical protein U9Q80_02390 [Bacillota bacterium]|nr:hypothetical protein [Bacillota bacterium]
MKRAKAIIVSHKADERLVEFFQELDLEVILTKENKFVYEAVSDHPDLFVFQDKSRYIIEPNMYDYYVDRLKKFNIEIIKGKKSIGFKYPENVLYNSVVINGILIGSKYNDDSIQDYYDEKILVKQGYTKCNVLQVDDESFITTDVGIYNNTKCVFDVLLIEPRGILLDQMEYGFIGGTGGKISESEMIFTGNIELLEDYEKIKEFIESKNIKIHYPVDTELTDLGSIIPIY